MGSTVEAIRVLGNMINSELQKKIDLMQEYLAKLERYASLRVEDLRQDEEKRLAMERLFQLLVDEAVDINAALAYQLGGRIPESYKSTFYELVPLDVIDYDFAERIAESVRIRNELTHDYEKLPTVTVIKEIKKFFPLYQDYARRLVEKLIAGTS